MASVSRLNRYRQNAGPDQPRFRVPNNPVCKLQLTGRKFNSIVRDPRAINRRNQPVGY